MFNMQPQQKAKLKKHCCGSGRQSTRSGQGQWALLLGQSFGLEGKKPLCHDWTLKGTGARVESGSASLYGLRTSQPQFPSTTYFISESASHSIVSLFYTLHPLTQPLSRQQACSWTRETFRQHVSHSSSQITSTSTLTSDGNERWEKIFTDISVHTNEYSQRLFWHFENNGAILWNQRTAPCFFIGRNINKHSPIWIRLQACATIRLTS